MSHRIVRPSSSPWRRFAVGFTGVALAAGLVVSPGVAQADQASACAAMAAAVHERLNPSSQVSLLTTSAAAANAAAGSFPVDLGTAFRASTSRVSGLQEIRDLYRPSTTDALYVATGAESAAAIASYGYVDRGVAFYASGTPLPCSVPVYRYRGSAHRFAVSSSDRAALSAAGWVGEGVAFYAVPSTTPAGAQGPADNDGTFSFAVMPDTQQEVLSGSRFINRTQWLAAHAGADDLDLRFVTHTGDVVNWDTPDHSQYKVASKGMVPLENAGIPYSLSIGNHDSQATGVGGSARDTRRTRALARDTSVFNRYFSAADYGDVGGAFEPNKVDNIWSAFEAGGANWLVLNLEIWPRVKVVEWAKTVVEAHPHHNVIVVTHAYIDGNGRIGQSGEYGDTSPQFLYDNFIRIYPNIKMVFSGHVDIAASRTDVGINGNTIYSFLAAIHSNTTNPVRIVTINTVAGTIASEIVAPWDGSNAWRPYDLSIGGVHWVS